MRVVSFVILRLFGPNRGPNGRDIDKETTQRRLWSSRRRRGTSRRRATRRAPAQVLPLHPVVHADPFPLPSRVLVVGDGLFEELEEHGAVGLVEPARVAVSTRSETAQNLSKNHPPPSFLETMRVDGVKGRRDRTRAASSRPS